jgi:endoglucanase
MAVASSERRFRARVIGMLAAAVVALTVGLVAPLSAQAAAPSGWLHTSGSKILASDNSVYTIKAVNWFGMETSNCAPHGLWSISLDQGMREIASMGFNTIRLPFSNECLAASSTTSINQNLNPTLVSLTPLQLMDVVIARAKAYGLHVILDRHRPDSGSQSALWYTSQYSEQKWIADWTMLATRYRNDPTVIGADLHNEPHDPSCWGCGNAATDWQAAATRAGNAVLAANPNLLIIVEGVSTQADGSTTWWGGGLKDVAKKPVVLTVANRVVYSSHDYPASVYNQSWFSAGNYPANLPGVWDANWGYLQKQNIAPVFVGEFGTLLQTTSDKQWLASIVSYIRANGLSYGYWSFNPNSGDTGGLVADDWTTPQAAKLAALAPILSPVTPPSPAPLSPSASPSTSPSPLPTPTATPAPSPSATTAPSSPPAASPAPSPTVSAPPVATPSPSAPKPVTSGTVTTAWQLQSAWQAGYVANFVVTASSAVHGWSISWSSPSATQIVSAWGMGCTLAGTTITCTGKDWAGPLSAGQSVWVGLQVAATSAPANPALTVTAN